MTFSKLTHFPRVFAARPCSQVTLIVGPSLKVSSHTSEFCGHRIVEIGLRVSCQGEKGVQATGEARLRGLWQSALSWFLLGTLI